MTKTTKQPTTPKAATTTGSKKAAAKAAVRKPVAKSAVTAKISAPPVKTLGEVIKQAMIDQNISSAVNATITLNETGMTVTVPSYDTGYGAQPVTDFDINTLKLLMSGKASAR